jgi:hypothetical protein
MFSVRYQLSYKCYSDSRSIVNVRSMVMRSTGPAQILLITNCKSTSYTFTYFTSWLFTLSQMHLNQKDERALPGSRQSYKITRPPPPSRYGLSLSLSLSNQASN